MYVLKNIIDMVDSLYIYKAMFLCQLGKLLEDLSEINIKMSLTEGAG